LVGGDDVREVVGVYDAPGVVASNCSSGITAFGGKPMSYARSLRMRASYMSKYAILDHLQNNVVRTRIDSGAITTGWVTT
jgi:hypothetical protein